MGKSMTPSEPIRSMTSLMDLKPLARTNIYVILISVSAPGAPTGPDPSRISSRRCSDTTRRAVAAATSRHRSKNYARNTSAGWTRLTTTPCSTWPRGTVTSTLSEVSSKASEVGNWSRLPTRKTLPLSPWHLSMDRYHLKTLHTRKSRLTWKSILVFGPTG